MAFLRQHPLRSIDIHLTNPTTVINKSLVSKNIIQIKGIAFCNGKKSNQQVPSNMVARSPWNKFNLIRLHQVCQTIQISSASLSYFDYTWYDFDSNRLYWWWPLRLYWAENPSEILCAHGNAQIEEEIYRHFKYLISLEIK